MSRLGQQWNTQEFQRISLEPEVTTSDLPVISNILWRRGILKQEGTITSNQIKELLMDLTDIPTRVDIISALITSITYNYSAPIEEAGIKLEELIVTLNLYFDLDLTSDEDWVDAQHYHQNLGFLRELFRTLSAGVFVLLKDKFGDLPRYKEILNGAEA